MDMDMNIEELDLPATEVLCQEIKQAAVTLEKHAAETYTTTRRILKRMKSAPPDLDPSIPLTPKEPLASWLGEHGILASSISFEEWFSLFLATYAETEPHRLDYVSRTIYLRETDAHLLQLPADTPTSIFQLLSRLPLLFK